MRHTTETKRIVFSLLIMAMLALAAGHLYVLDGFTGIILGLPGWLWVQLVVIGVLFILAWLATDIATPTEGA